MTVDHPAPLIYFLSEANSYDVLRGFDIDINCTDSIIFYIALSSCTFMEILSTLTIRSILTCSDGTDILYHKPYLSQTAEMGLFAIDESFIDAMNSHAGFCLEKYTFVPPNKYYNLLLSPVVYLSQ